MGKSERRRADRTALVIDVRYEGQSAGSKCRISDISRTGAFIDTMAPLPVGSIVRFIFRLPGSEPISAEGKVVHTHHGIGMGVEFRAMNSDGFQALSHFLSQRQVASYLPPAGRAESPMTNHSKEAA